MATGYGLRAWIYRVWIRHQQVIIPDEIDVLF